MPGDQPIYYPAPRDVRREVSQLSDTGFEGYVADRFNALPGWSAWETRASGDQGIDVCVTAPDGTKYAVQCKRYSSSVGAQDAQKTVGGGAYYRVPTDRCMLVAAHPGGFLDGDFTDPARAYAAGTGLLLWTLCELQVVADAGTTGNVGALDEIGLRIAQPAVFALPIPPTSPEPLEPPKTPSATRRRWLASAVAVGVVTCAALALARPPALSPVTARRWSPSDERAVRAAIERHDLAYIEANRSGNATLLRAVMTGAALREQTSRIEARNAQGCVVLSEPRLPSRIDRISLEANRATAWVRKDWGFTKRCVGKLDDPMLEDDGQFVMRYDLERAGSSWLVAKRTVE